MISKLYMTLSWFSSHLNWNVLLRYVLCNVLTSVLHVINSFVLFLLGLFLYLVLRFPVILVIRIYGVTAHVIDV
jgi:hypothetical protein